MTTASPPWHRIKGHRRVRAGDLVPHELNPRRHSETQRAALAALYEEIGFARSLLAYELPDGRLKLIDGHLRQSMDLDMEVEVEILDVDDEEARKLLLSLDPLALLADYDARALDHLREITATDSEAIHDLWQSIQAGESAVREQLGSARQPKEQGQTLPEQYLIVIECRDEAHQVELLQRFQNEGLSCQAKIA
jgi:ParB-like chromosome segregation protein Spo0J